jgi:hypothetical protein
MGKVRFVVLWLLPASILTGCMLIPPIPIPLPSYGVEGEAVAQVRVGQSARADVHALLGEPNRLASLQHEVWELEYEPPRILLTGWDKMLYPDQLPSRATVAVEYDLEGKVARWRLEGRTLEPVDFAEPERFRDYVHDASEPEPKPFEPLPVLPWRAHALAVSPDGQRVALMAASLRIRVVEVPSGREIAASVDWPHVCGTEAIALGFAETGIVSLPATGSQLGGPCEWREQGGELIGAPASAPEMTWDLEGSRLVRIRGRFAIARREDGSVSVWDLSGALVTVLNSERFRYRPTSVAIAPDGSLVAIELAVEPDAMPELLLHHVATGAERVLTLPGPAHQPQPLAALALAPSGELLAIDRWTHVEVWRLGGPEATPVLEAALPLPPPMAGGGLGFSQDGGRLVSESGIDLIWETQSWRPIVRTTRRTLSNAPTLQLTQDGSHVATPSGLIRIVPQSAPPTAGN